MSTMRIFVSHSHQNNAFCAELVQVLRSAGADVWYDDESLQTGQLGPIIEREIRERPVFIVVLSPASLASRWVEDETRWAYKLRGRDPSRIILPVLAEPLAGEDSIWLFLQDFKRVEAPGIKPYPQAEAINRTLHALELTQPGEAPQPTASLPTALRLGESPQPTESADDLVMRGKALSAQNRHAEALPLFERATQFDPRSLDARVNLGWTLIVLRRYEEALDAFDRTLALDTTNTYARNGKGVALNGLKRRRESLAAYDQALALDSNSAANWYIKAVALNERKLYHESLVAFDRALALDPKETYAWNGRGSALHELKQYQQALAAYDQALALDPNYARAWNNKAISLRALGWTRDAEEAERQAEAAQRRLHDLYG
jgi:tetratricopeptide (TPR) repeat protein